MANTYTLIQAQTLTTSAASVTFSSIPATFTDLKMTSSIRSDDSASASGSFYTISFNGSTASFTNKFLRGNGSAASSGSFAAYAGNSVTTAQTANTFSNDEIYIPNYTSSNDKSFSGDGVTENNAAGAFVTFNAGLWSNTVAITSLTLTAGVGSFLTNSTFYLYGIKNS